MRVTGAIEISKLYIYPIKSCRGVSVAQAEVVERGFAGDRRYMVVDDDGRFITQREEHTLALVSTELAGDELRLSAPDLPAFSLPMTLESGERVPVEVWGYECEALVEAEGSRWLSRHLGRSCRLVYMPDDVERPVNPKRAPQGRKVGFQDGYPFLMVSEASLADVSERTGMPGDARRFRPNMVIRGIAPFEEDEIAEFSVGALQFANVKPCERCVVVDIDPDTSVVGKEPLATLARYRKRETGVMFGVNLVHSGTGTIRIGDRVVRTRDHVLG